MKKILIFLSAFSFMFSTTIGQSTLNGVIYYQNSNGKSARGVEISAFGCNAPPSDENGMFILTCITKKAGETIKLIVGSEDSSGKAIEVVNDKVLDYLRIPDKPDHYPIEIIVCYAGEKNKTAMKYYNLLERVNAQEYEIRLASIENKLQQNNLDANIIAFLTKQMDALRKEKEAILEKIEEQAIFIASINQDKASDLVKFAIQKIELEEDVEGALLVLEDVKLEDAYLLSLDDKLKAEEQIQQVIEGYELKINLLLPKFKYQEIISYYYKIIEIYNKNKLDKADLAKWYRKAANVIYDYGRYRNALDFQQKSISIREEILDPKHPDLATSYSDIGNTYNALGKYKEALEFHQRSITIREEILNSAHPDLATSFNNTSNTYKALGQYNKALEFQQKSIEIREEILGGKHPDLATSYSNIASTYEIIGQYQKALGFHQKSIVIGEEILGLKHPDLATFYDNIGVTYNSLGRYERALEFHQKSIDIRNEIFDSNHPDLAISYNNLGVTYNSLGEYEIALEFQQKSIAIQTEIFDPNHPDLATSFNDISSTYRALGQYEKVLEFQQKSVGIRSEIFDPNHPDLATSFNNIGVTFQVLGFYEKAMDFHQKSIAIRNEIFDPNHPDLAISYSNIGITYKSLKKNKKALKFHQKSIDILEEIFDSNHLDLATSYRNIASTYQSLRKYEKALEFQQKCIEIIEKIFDPKHLDLATAFNNISMTYEGLGQHEKSLEFQQKAFNIFEEILPVNYLNQQIVLTNFHKMKALSFYRKKNYNEALANFRASNGHSENHSDWNYIGLCYFYLEDYSKAVEAYKKAASLNSEIKRKQYYSNIGTVYAKNKQSKKAKSAFQAYEKLFPKEGRPQRNWAMYYALQNDNKKALTHLQKAIDLGFDDLEWLKPMIVWTV